MVGELQPLDNCGSIGFGAAGKVVSPSARPDERMMTLRVMAERHAPRRAPRRHLGSHGTRDHRCLRSTTTTRERLDRGPSQWKIRAKVAEETPKTSKKKRKGGSKIDDDQRYPLWFALPLQPGERRVTKRYEILPNKIYAFEQLLGTLDVIVNSRMTVVALKEGGLFVHSPIAPTKECLRLVGELEDKHGPVKYIVLPTTAVEHKIYFGPFAKQYPDAEIYAAPRQWSFPLNLPLALLGLFPRKAVTIAEDGDYPWKSEFEIAVLNLTVGIGPFVEVSFFHKPTRTLLVTDTVFKIPESPPEVCEVDPSPLLKRARDDKRDGLVMSEDTRENRIIGWWKTTLFAIFFQPSSVEFDLREYPTTLVWRDDKWIDKVKSVQNKLLVAPILQVLVFSRDPNGALEVREIRSNPIRSDLPCITTRRSAHSFIPALRAH